MNQHDQNNLDYLLSLDADEFESFLMIASDDDIQYALELIRAGRSELIEQEMALLDDVEDLTLANKVLSKFVNKG